MTSLLNFQGHVKHERCTVTLVRHRECHTATQSECISPIVISRCLLGRRYLCVYVVSSTCSHIVIEQLLLSEAWTTLVAYRVLRSQTILVYCLIQDCQVGPVVIFGGSNSSVLHTFFPSCSFLALSISFPLPLPSISLCFLFSPSFPFPRLCSCGTWKST